MKYQETGTKIPIKKNELMELVFQELEAYEDYVKRNNGKEEISNSPFNNQILLTTSEGKTIQVPIEIQEEAINIYLQQREKEQENNENSENDEYNENNYDMKQIEVEQDNTLYYILVAIVIIFIGFILISNNNIRIN